MKGLSNLAMIIFVLTLVTMFFIGTKEKFSSSGLGMSNVYCNKLAYTYHQPKNDDMKCRMKHMDRICGGVRRDTVHKPTGNYYTVGGLLR